MPTATTADFEAVDELGHLLTEAQTKLGDLHARCNPELHAAMLDILLLAESTQMRLRTCLEQSV